MLRVDLIASAIDYYSTSVVLRAYVVRFPLLIIIGGFMPDCNCQEYFNATEPMYTGCSPVFCSEYHTFEDGCHKCPAWEGVCE